MYKIATTWNRMGQHILESHQGVRWVYSFFRLIEIAGLYKYNITILPLHPDHVELLRNTGNKLKVYTSNLRTNI